MNDINLLVISDTHRSLRDEQEKIIDKVRLKSDLVITLGDVPFEGLLYIKPDFGVLGNHDSFGLLGTWDIHGKMVEKNGVTLVGFEGSSRYKDGCFPMYSQEESLKIDLLKADILISHDRIFKGILDDAHTGLKGITQYLEKHSPFLHIHGHHHKQEVYKYNETTVISVYKCVFIEVKNNIIKVKELF